MELQLINISAPERNYLFCCVEGFQLPLLLFGQVENVAFAETPPVRLEVLVAFDEVLCVKEALHQLGILNGYLFQK